MRLEIRQIADDGSGVSRRRGSQEPMPIRMPGEFDPMYDDLSVDRSGELMNRIIAGRLRGQAMIELHSGSNWQYIRLRTVGRTLYRRASEVVSNRQSIREQLTAR